MCLAPSCNPRGTHMAQATLTHNGYQKHPTNTRIYVAKAHGTTWHIRKHGHGRKRTRNGNLSESTTRFVATQQTFRGGVIARPSLHEVIAALRITEQMEAAANVLGLSIHNN